MTIVVGVLCEDGIVIGADSSATFVEGVRPTIEQRTEKIQIIHDCIAVAGTGPIGLSQRFCWVINEKWLELREKSAMEIALTLARETIGNFQFTGVQRGEYGALMAFPAQGKLHLCEFAVRDFQPEFKTERLWYVSMGSGQSIADPFLGFIRGMFWQDECPSIQEAIFAVTWTLEHAIAVNAGGINGPARIAALECDHNQSVTVRVLSEEELDEHRQNIEEAKSLLRGFRAKHTETDIPDIPQP
jgi:20S proteasome alpha/beta subunit